MIHTTNDFFNKVATEIRQTYFIGEKHGYTTNVNYHNAGSTIELFNNGCLTYRKFINRLAKYCNESRGNIHEIVSKYVTSFGTTYNYNTKN